MCLSQIRIPVPGADRVWMRLPPLPQAGEFCPEDWRHERSWPDGNWWQINNTSSDWGIG